MVVVTGETGIGKTTLARAVAQRAVDSGAFVAWGTWVEGSGAPGYSLWMQAVNSIVRSIGLDRAADAAGEDLSLLAAIVTELHVAVRRGAASNDVSSDSLPVLLWDALARWLEHIELEGLDAEAVARLVERISGGSVDAAAGRAIFDRTAGHPFFARELALLAGTDVGGGLPAAVRDAPSSVG